MKVLITDESEDGYHLSFKLIGATYAVANALRRIMMTEIRSFVFDDIQFEHNSTVYTIDYLIHRISLIPVTTKGKVDEKDVYEINAKCDQASSIMTVYSHDIKKISGSS